MIDCCSLCAARYGQSATRRSLAPVFLSQGFTFNVGCLLPNTRNSTKNMTPSAFGCSAIQPNKNEDVICIFFGYMPLCVCVVTIATGFSLFFSESDATTNAHARTHRDTRLIIIMRHYPDPVRPPRGRQQEVEGGSAYMRNAQQDSTEITTDDVAVGRAGLESRVHTARLLRTARNMQRFNKPH